MTRSIRRCPICTARDGEHYPECSIPVLAALTERAVSRRVWTISVAVECGTCGVTDDKTSVAATSCETAREGVLRILRYRGWRIGRKTHDNSCPACAGPIPGCADCGTPTPDPYGKSDWSEQHKVRRCAECHRKHRAAQWRADYPDMPVPEWLTREDTE